MTWTDQNPEATDVLFQGRILWHGKQTAFEIDRLASGQFRATIGDLFGSAAIHTDGDLDQLLRWTMLSASATNKGVA